MERSSNRKKKPASSRRKTSPPSRKGKKRKELECEERPGSQAAGLAFDADEHRAAQKKRQSPIKGREVPAQVIEDGVAGVDQALCIGDLKG